MRRIQVPHLIWAAAIGWLILIGFQVVWIKDSRDMIEEQFDQKVSLALCSAVSSLDKGVAASCVTSSPSETAVCQPAIHNYDEVAIDPSMELEPKLYQAVDNALAFYNIHIDYTLALQDPRAPNCDPTSPYCCAIDPFKPAQTAMLQISFPGKGAYLLGKIWGMLASSVAILLFILAVFVLALRALIHQKRVSAWNIDFFNNMAHEFKTPLTNIRLAMQRLVDKHPDLAQDAYVNVVRNEDDKLGGQVERMLAMAAMEESSQQLDQQKIDLTELIGTVVDDMRLQIQEKKAHITFEAAPGMFIEGDHFHLSRVFRNLLDNALKYAGNAPEISIRIMRKASQIEVNFEDNGPGIARENREMIFNKYHRVPNGNVQQARGFGLGLSYVKTIVEQHSGTIRALGKSDGAYFHMTIPAIAS